METVAHWPSSSSSASATHSPHGGTEVRHHVNNTNVPTLQSIEKIALAKTCVISPVTYPLKQRAPDCDTSLRVEWTWCHRPQNEAMATARSPCGSLLRRTVAPHSALKKNEPMSLRRDFITATELWSYAAVVWNSHLSGSYQLSQRWMKWKRSLILACVCMPVECKVSCAHTCC